MSEVNFSRSPFDFWNIFCWYHSGSVAHTHSHKCWRTHSHTCSNEARSHTHTLAHTESNLKTSNATTEQMKDVNTCHPWERNEIKNHTTGRILTRLRVKFLIFPDLNPEPITTTTDKTTHVTTRIPLAEHDIDQRMRTAAQSCVQHRPDERDGAIEWLGVRALEARRTEASDGRLRLKLASDPNCSHSGVIPSIHIEATQPTPLSFRLQKGRSRSSHGAQSPKSPGD